MTATTKRGVTIVTLLIIAGGGAYYATGRVATADARAECSDLLQASLPFGKLNTSQLSIGDVLAVGADGKAQRLFRVPIHDSLTVTSQAIDTILVAAALSLAINVDGDIPAAVKAEIAASLRQSAQLRVIGLRRRDIGNPGIVFRGHPDLERQAAEARVETVTDSSQRRTIQFRQLFLVATEVGASRMSVEVASESETASTSKTATVSGYDVAVSSSCDVTYTASGADAPPLFVKLVEVVPSDSGLRISARPVNLDSIDLRTAYSRDIGVPHTISAQ